MSESNESISLKSTSLRVSVMSDAKFQINDVVRVARLRDSPRMVVTGSFRTSFVHGASPPAYPCIWFTARQELQTGIFPEEVLVAWPTETRNSR